MQQVALNIFRVSLKHFLEIFQMIAGTRDAPSEGHVAAIQAFMPHASESIERLRRQLPIAFLWRPIRLIPNNENRVGVQFQHRISHRLEVLFD